VNEDLVFSEPTLLMPAIPKPIGVATGYDQQIDDLRWHPDGSWLWFGHAFQQDFSTPGGGTLAGVDPGTGALELYLDSAGDCTVNTGPSPSPDGTVLLSIRGVCIDAAHEGFVAFDVPPAGEPEMIVPTSEALFTTPRWLPDGAGIVYAARIDYDSDGDGAFDIYGNAIILLDLATGDQYALLPPAPEVYVWEITLSPAGDRVVACVSQDDAQNLLLLDYSVDPPETRWLTDDGISCRPSW
jgi:Tol biopolymer transport system component